MIKYLSISFGLLYSVVGFTQTTYQTLDDQTLSSVDDQTIKTKNIERLPIHFGFQFRSILPTNFGVNRFVPLTNQTFDATVSNRVGFGFGGALRIGITKSFALETGVNYTQHQYNLNVSLSDSDIEGTRDMAFTEFDIPINALFYIPLKEKLFLNTSLGASISYKPFDTQGTIFPEAPHDFRFYGFRDNIIGYSLNANAGLEYRTEKSGFFYFGASASLSYTPRMQYFVIYNNDMESMIASAQASSSLLTLDFKYFFPIKTKKQG